MNVPKKIIDQAKAKALAHINAVNKDVLILVECESSLAYDVYVFKEDSTWQAHLYTGEVNDQGEFENDFAKPVTIELGASER